MLSTIRELAIVIAQNPTKVIGSTVLMLGLVNLPGILAILDLAGKF